MTAGQVVEEPEAEDEPAPAAPTGEGLDKCRAGIEAAARAAQSKLRGVLDPAGGGDLLDGRLWDGVTEALSQLTKAAVEQARQLWEFDTEMARKSLRQSKTTYDMKLQVSRTAGQVSLQNQAAEMQAAHNRMLEARVSEISNDGDSALEDAHKQMEALSRKLESSLATQAKLKDLYNTTLKLQEAAEARTKAREAELAKKQEELNSLDLEKTREIAVLEARLAKAEAITTELEEARQTILGQKEEAREASRLHASLSTQHTTLRTAHQDLANKVTELAAALREVEASYELYRRGAEEREAAAEAASAARLEVVVEAHEGKMSAASQREKVRACLRACVRLCMRQTSERRGCCMRYDARSSGICMHAHARAYIRTCRCCSTRFSTRSGTA